MERGPGTYADEQKFGDDSISYSISGYRKNL